MSKKIDMQYLATRMNDILPEELNDTAEYYAEIFAKKDRLKTNQLRNFYAAITKMRIDYERAKEDFSSIETDLIMLKPKLAYAAGRQKAVRDNFFPFMKNAIDGVSQAGNQHKALLNFFNLVESVVAYHKYHGGE